MDTGELIAGRYRLEAPIGAGGMGVVWRATDEAATGEELGRTVGVKRVQLGEWATPAERQRAVDRLRREARIAASLRHPRVVTLHEVVEDGDQPWLVMEYVPSRNLAEVLAQDGRLAPPRAAQIGAQIADALAHAHGAGVVHRDVTPRNVLVAADGSVKLTDFGISRSTGDVTLTGRGLPQGVPAYFAPEVASGRAATDRSDVFSLGATLYAAVEGTPPWGAGDDVLGVIRRATRGAVAPPVRAGALAPVLLEMLRRRPGDRPAAARAHRLLDDVAAGRRIRSAPRRRTAVVMVAVAGALVVTAGGLVAFAAGQREEPDVSRAGIGRPGLGDPRTADPCALIQEEPFDRFDETTLETDYGNFNRCDVIMESNGSRFGVRVQFEISDTESLPDGQVENRGGIVVGPQARVDDECLRTLFLPDGNEVQVAAGPERGDPPDLCTIADIATENAFSVLARGEVPRRSVPFAATSLAGVDACALIDPATVPGLGTATPDASFGGWECTWDTPVSDAEVDIYYDRYFDRDEALSRYGAPLDIGGRDAAAEPDDGSDTECDVTIIHRSYVDSDGNEAVELVHIDVTQPAPVPDVCAPALEVAAAAVARLPAPS